MTKVACSATDCSYNADRRCNLETLNIAASTDGTDCGDYDPMGGNTAPATGRHGGGGIRAGGGLSERTGAGPYGGLQAGDADETARLSGFLGVDV